VTVYLSRQLKKLRRERGNTREDLAAHLGITVQAVSKWERGEGYPDITLLPAVASCYNVSIDDLLGVGQIEKEKKLNEYVDRDHKYWQEGRIAESLKLWREARESVDATPANEGCEPREGSEPREALSATELARLRLCSWPGNIRQLKNVLQRYALLKPHGITLCEILGEEFAVPLCGEDNHNPVYRGATFRTPTPDWKIIERTLEKFRGNKMQTARALGISRSNLYNLIKKNEFGVPYKAMAQ